MLRKNPFYDDAYVCGRWIELLRLFESFKTEYELENGGAITLGIDEIALYQAVVSYFHDVARYKWWHFTDDPENHRVDDTKKSAYMVYWLNKIRPLYVDRSGIDPTTLAATLDDDTSIIANALFALTVAYGYLDLVFADDIAEQFLYILTYRSTEPNPLIFVFQIAENIRDGKPVIAA